MFCKGCKYNLIELSDPRCPECGREFNAADPSTFDQHPRMHRRWIGRLCTVISLYPLLVLALLYLTWITAAVSRGHWPRPYLDDPKYINGIVSAFHVAT